MTAEQLAIIIIFIIIGFLVLLAFAVATLITVIVWRTLRKEDW